jgi:hypothetical protein
MYILTFRQNINQYIPGMQFNIKISNHPDNELKTEDIHTKTSQHTKLFQNSFEQVFFNQVKK